MHGTSTALEIRPPPPLVRFGGDLDVDRLLGIFLSGRNGKTIEAYRADLHAFAGYVSAPTLDEAARYLLSLGQGAANGTALSYRGFMVDSGLSANTVNRRLSALRSLVKLAQTIGVVPWTLSVENVRSQAYRDTKGPGITAFRAMLRAAGAGRGAKAARDTALLRLLHDTALRRNEVLALDLSDVEADTVAIIGKGKTEKQMITLPDPTKAALLAWIAVRGSEPGPLFGNVDRAGKGGKRLTGAGLYSVVRSLGAAVGVKTRPHGLRHLAITSALDASLPLRDVQRFSRHASVNILSTYDDNRQDLGGAVARIVAGGV